jgi:signal transduction histidine kinase
VSAAASRTVLLVEDSPEDAVELRRLLARAREPFEVVHAATGAEGLALVRDARPACVLLDFHLPDMDAGEFLDALRRQGGGRLPVPVVTLTGQEDGRSATAALAQGAQDYVVKGTFTAQGLGRAIENAVEKFAIQAELEEKRVALEVRNIELEALRNELQANLVELADATRAKDQFLAVMSHEMRTPLNAILGYVDLLDLGVADELTEAQRAHLARIRVGGRHLLDLINDVLDLSRADARKLELDIRPVDVAAVLEEVTTLLESQAQAKGLELRTELCPEPLPPAMADLQRLRQVLTNLVANAVKFTDRGTVQVRCSPPENGMVRIVISDTGIGIAPEVLPLIFTEFFQAEGTLTRNYGGSGLGLAIAQRLTRLMGGEVLVDSTPGRGSTFTVLIPSAAEGSVLRDEDVQLHDAAMEPHRPRPPVTVVAYGEHTDGLAQLQRRVHPAVRLVWTTDSAAVPDLARSERASLVVLDVSSGDGAAWAAAYALRDLTELSSTAVLLLPSIPRETSDAPPEGFDLGWVSLVPKPFTAAQLTHAVATAARGGHEPPAQPDTRTVDVLVVDDDEDSRRVAAKFLESARVTVREAQDGETALAAMRRHPPDVAVLDLMMPVLDGFGVLAAMRADPLLAAVPVVVLSAKNLTEPERRFLARTAVQVLQKGEHRLADVAALVLRAAAGAPPPGTFGPPPSATPPPG